MTPLPAEQRTLPWLLARGATLYADRELLRIGETSLTFAQVQERASRRAGQLMSDGIGPGDRVAVMAENRIELIELFLGCAWLGASVVPVNTALRGPGLEHVLQDSGSRALAIEQSLVDRLDVVRRPGSLAQIWTLAGTEATGSLPALGEVVEPAALRPGDTAAVLYTSGTTGPSKGVLCPHGQWYWWGLVTGRVLGVSEGSVLSTSLPLFHTNALNAFCQALLSGATFVAGERFSASRFWEQLSAQKATVTYLLGPMVSILLRTPPGRSDRAHQVEVALAPATPSEFHEPFRFRFGVDLIDAWGSTETNCVISNTRNDITPGTIGRVQPEFEVRIVDANDEELPDGTPGELVVRSRQPFAFSSGYLGRSDQTVAAWQNLWHHTGDRAVGDPDGTFRFVDRMKDAIRRRGENISSYEVEQVIASHPDVVAVAVVAVPADIGEDEVLAVIVPRPGAQLDPAELLQHCVPLLAYFAVPRYVELVAELPVTANGKVEKFRLREQGVTATTWDREQAGITVSR